MPSKNEPKGWALESFLDSLILELDKAQDTLSVKGINRKLTYTVKDVSLDLQVYPSFIGDRVVFNNAKPGDTGASRLSFQLGSISDRQIRETTKEPEKITDIAIDEIEEIDDDVKQTLKRVGIKSAEDIERLSRRNVDIEKVVTEKVPSGKAIKYNELANLINKARRRKMPPTVSHLSMEKSMSGNSELIIKGSNLVLGMTSDYQPVAVLNNNPLKVLLATPDEVRVALTHLPADKSMNSFVMALDPYAVMKFNIRIPGEYHNENCIDKSA